MQHDLIVFSNVDDHPLSRFLEPGFRHVTAVLRVNDTMWVQYDWSPSKVMASPVHSSRRELAAFYMDHGGKVFPRPVSFRRWPSAMPIMLNNCVGHTKSILGIPCWAVTPYQLYNYLMKEAFPCS